MTDVDILVEPNSLPGDSSMSSINTTGTAAKMVMTRSQSREMETTNNVYITNTNPEDDAAAARDREGPHMICLLYTSPSPRDQRGSRMPSSA